MKVENIRVVNEEDLSKQEFEREYLWKGVPVIIRSGSRFGWDGGKEETDGEGESSRLGEGVGKTHVDWNMEYLLEQCGANQVYCREDTDSHDYKIGKRYGIKHMTFREYAHFLLEEAGLEPISNGCEEKAKGKTSAKQHHKGKRNQPKGMGNGKSKISYYMAVQNIAHVFPEIAKEFQVPKYVGKLHAGPFLWIGKPGHYEFCHMDPDDGMLMMIRGKKKARLFHYRYLENLYPHPHPSLGRTIQARASFDTPDFEKFPLLRDVVCEEGVLHPQDMLFIPAFYWHQITGLDCSSEEEHSGGEQNLTDFDHACTISANMFWGDAGRNRFFEKIFADEERLEVFRFWFFNVISQNQEASPVFQTMINDMKRVLSGFFHTQYHEFPSEEQLQWLVDMALTYCKEEYGMVPETLSADDEQRRYPPRMKIRGLISRS
eukprot:Nk52_evm10s545 gene=Nk52_evmTU10s545